MRGKALIFGALIIAAGIATVFHLPDWTICAGGLVIYGLLALLSSRR